MINAAAETRGNDPEQMAVPADWLASMFLFWLQI
jgi:hypothetical protein